MSAAGGALLAAATLAWTNQGATRPTAVLAALLALFLAAALPFVASPITVLAVGLSGLAFVSWGGRLTGLVGPPLVTVAVAFLSPALGVAVAGALWWRAPHSRAKDAVALMAALAVTLAPGSDVTLRRAAALMMLAGMALLFRRPIEQRTLTEGGRRVLTGIAAALPAGALVFLLVADGRLFTLAPNDLVGAWLYAAGAVAAALIAGIVIVGTSIVLSTRNDARLVLVGTLLCAAVATALVGRSASMVLLLPVAFGFGVGVLVLVPPGWRTRLRTMPRPALLQ